MDECYKSAVRCCINERQQTERNYSKCYNKYNYNSIEDEDWRCNEINTAVFERARGFRPLKKDHYQSWGH